MKEVIDLYRPSIKKHPVRWCVLLVLGYFLYHFIPPIAVASGNYVAKVLFEKKDRSETTKAPKSKI